MLQEAGATIASIYDAAGNSDRWNHALDGCVDFVGASGANLMVNEIDGDVRWQFDVGNHFWRTLDRERTIAAIQHFRQHEGRAWQYIHRQPKQTLCRDTDFITDQELLDSREDYVFFRNELGLGRRVGACLNDNKCWSDNIAFQFDAKLKRVTDLQLDKIRLLLPHAAKSVELWRTFSKLKRRYNAVLNVLDHVAVGLCIVLPDGTIVAHNSEAERIFSERPGIWLDRHDKIRCRHAATEQSLNKAITSTTISDNRTHTRAECLFTVTEPVGGNPLLIEVTPLRDGEREMANNFSGSLVTLIDPSVPRQFDITRLRQGYKLSEAEGAVCNLLVDGWTNQAIAEERNVRPDTVKSQVKRIFNKTGTARRSDLVRLCLKTDPPVK